MELGEHGHDVVHVSELGLASAPDGEILEAARQQARVVLSADTDFGTLLAASRAAAPSVILIRRGAGRRVHDLASLIEANLPQLEADLGRGSVVGSADYPRQMRRLYFV